MVLNNTDCTEKGDEIIFQTAPLFGLQGFNSIVETMINVSSTLYFSRFFCYSFDGVVFTNWLQFDGVVSVLENEITPKLTAKTEPVLKFKYQRDGTDLSSTPLSLTDLTINARYAIPSPVYNTASKSIYKKLVYDDIDVYNLMVNLATKMYQQGIIPSYMIRGENDGDILVDKNYIEFWSTVAKFFALIFIHTCQFRNIFWRRELLAEFLSQKGIFFSDKDNVIEMQLIASNFFDEIRQRGTSYIFHKKDQEIAMGRRYLYYMPVGFIISPSTPLYIDGVAYSEVDELPFGWLISGSVVIAPDLNHHTLSIINPTSIAGDFNADFNIDFLIDFNTTGGVMLMPAATRTGIYKQYNGEYLRLINYDNKNDEFIYNQVNPKNLGWTLNNSSPLYRGMRIHDNPSLLKSYEPNTDDFVDLANYPIL